MPKYANDLVMDAALDYVAASTAMHVCSTLPAIPTRAQVITASLANVAMTTGDFTKADGDTNGRKVTTTAKNAVAVTATGTATDIALIDGTIVRYTTTCTSQALTSGNTVNVPGWKVEIADPA
jgi:hypothetical protein